MEKSRVQGACDHARWHLFCHLHSGTARRGAPAFPWGLFRGNDSISTSIFIVPLLCMCLTLCSGLSRIQSHVLRTGPVFPHRTAKEAELRLQPSLSGSEPSAGPFPTVPRALSYQERHSQMTVGFGSSAFVYACCTRHMRGSEESCNLLHLVDWVSWWI
jgi:hypothetical protein